MEIDGLPFSFFDSTVGIGSPGESVASAATNLTMGASTVGSTTPADPTPGQFSFSPVGLGHGIDIDYIDDIDDEDDDDTQRHLGGSPRVRIVGSSPDGRLAKKRRLSDPPSDQSDCGADPVTSLQSGPTKKTAHNVIEKRYRTKLNMQFAILQDTVPSLRVTRRRKTRGTAAVTPVKKKADGQDEDLGGLMPAHKLNKATVLAKAVEYIGHLEERISTLTVDLERAKLRLAEISRPVLEVDTAGGLDGTSGAEIGSAADMSAVTGVIPMSAGVAALRRRAREADGVAPVASTTAAGTATSARPRSQMAGRVMLAALAGLVMIDGGGGDDSGDQLAALVPWARISGRDAVAAVRVCVALAALAAVVLPLLANLVMPGRPGKKVGMAVSGSAEAHHQTSFLTAARTVQLPVADASVAGAVAAVAAEATAAFFGRPSSARARAWAAAADAQLMGGDRAASIPRLLVGLVGGIVSGRADGGERADRMMRAAVQVAVISRLAGSTRPVLAGIVWNRAAGAGPTTPHRTALAQLSPDLVFSAPVAARLARMAMASTGVAVAVPRSTPTLTAWLDRPDPAVAAPLDLVGAAVSAVALHDALVAYLTLSAGSINDHGDDADEAAGGEDGEAGSEDVDGDSEAPDVVLGLLGRAVKTAPPGSAAHMRALAASAILLDGDDAAESLECVEAMLEQAEGHAPDDASVAVMLANTLSGTADIGAAAARFANSPSSLLSLVAAHTAVHVVGADQEDRNTHRAGLEQLAAAVRTAVGPDCRLSGLADPVRAGLVDASLALTRVLVGVA